MTNSPRKRTTNQIRAGEGLPPVGEHGPETMVPAVKAPEPKYDTFQVLADGGQYYLDGPVPTKPVRVDGALFTWWQTGACPWATPTAGEPDGAVTLSLANIMLQLTHTSILEDGGVLFEPAGHVWSQDAAWLQGSDGSETAVPR